MKHNYYVDLCYTQLILNWGCHYILYCVGQCHILIPLQNEQLNLQYEYHCLYADFYFFFFSLSIHCFSQSQSQFIIIIIKLDCYHNTIRIILSYLLDTVVNRAHNIVILSPKHAFVMGSVGVEIPRKTDALVRLIHCAVQPNVVIIVCCRILFRP